MNRSEAALIVVILIAALGLRVAYLRDWAASPYAGHPLLDEEYIHHWAQDIAGDHAGEEAFFRPPAYPYLLSLLYTIWGPGPVMPRFFQALFGAATALLTFLLARRWMEPRWAGAAALLTAANPILIHFDGELLATSMEIMLDMLFLLVFATAWGGRGEKHERTRSGPDLGSRWRWLAAGWIGGAAALTRPNILMPAGLLCLGAAAGFVRRKEAKAGAKRIGAMLLGFALVILPVTLRNRVVGKDWVLIASQSGINFFLGNAAFADGMQPNTPVTYSRHEGYEDSVEQFGRRAAEIETGRALKPSESSRYWTGKTLASIREDPMRWLGLMGRKALALLSNAEIRNGKSPEFAIEFSPWLSAWRRICNFSWLGPLALAGMAVSLIGRQDGIAAEAAPVRVSPNSLAASAMEEKRGLARRPAPSDHCLSMPDSRACPLFFQAESSVQRVLSLFTFGYALSILVFFVCSRFRAPMLPVLTIFAVGGVREALAALRDKKARAVSAWLALVAAGTVATNVDWLDISPQPRRFDLWLLRGIHEKDGDMAAAEKAVRESLDEERKYPDGLYTLGAYELAKGNLAGAVGLFEEATRADESYATAWNGLAGCHLALGDLKKAREEAQRCLALDPWHGLAWANLGEIERREGNLAAARAAFKKAIELYSTHYAGFLGLARVAAAEGKPEESKERLHEALRRNDAAVRNQAQKDPELRPILDNPPANP